MCARARCVCSPNHQHATHNTHNTKHNTQSQTTATRTATCTTSSTRPASRAASSPSSKAVGRRMVMPSSVMVSLSLWGARGAARLYFSTRARTLLSKDLLFFCLLNTPALFFFGAAAAAAAARRRFRRQAGVLFVGSYFRALRAAIGPQASAIHILTHSAVAPKKCHNVKQKNTALAEKLLLLLLARSSRGGGDGDKITRFPRQRSRGAQQT